MPSQFTTQLSSGHQVSTAGIQHRPLAFGPGANNAAIWHNLRCHLFDLPHDLFLMIAEYLLPEDRLMLQMTCRRYSNIFAISVADLRLASILVWN